MRLILLLATFTAYGLTIFLAPNEANAIQSVKSSRSNGSDWAPTAYRPGELPSGFKGVSIRKLLRKLKPYQRYLQKDEYETTAQYKNRLTSSVAYIAPAARTHKYAFLLRPAQVTYDADNQRYVVRDDEFCEPTRGYWQNEGRGWVTCKIGPLSRVQSSYIASTKSDEHVHVTKITGTDFAIAIYGTKLRTRDPYFSSQLIDQTRFPLKLETSFKYPLGEARDLRFDTIGVLLVGTFESATLIAGSPTTHEPNVYNPIDKRITQVAVPFTPTTLVLYVKETGIIIGRRSLKTK